MLGITRQINGGAIQLANRDHCSGREALYVHSSKGERDARAEAIKGTLELKYPCQRPQLSDVPWRYHGSLGLEPQSLVQDRNSIRLLQQFLYSILIYNNVGN